MGQWIVENDHAELAMWAFDCGWQESMQTSWYPPLSHRTRDSGDHTITRIHCMQSRITATLASQGRRWRHISQEDNIEKVVLHGHKAVCPVFLFSFPWLCCCFQFACIFLKRRTEKGRKKRNTSCKESTFSEACWHPKKHQVFLFTKQELFLHLCFLWLVSPLPPIPPPTRATPARGERAALARRR